MPNENGKNLVWEKEKAEQMAYASNKSRANAAEQRKHNDTLKNEPKKTGEEVAKRYDASAEQAEARAAVLFDLNNVIGFVSDEDLEIIKSIIYKSTARL